MICSVDGCARPTRSTNADLCNTHYFRKRRTGNVGSAEIWDRAKRACSMDGCDRPCAGLGFCSMHYQRVQAHGDPTQVAVQVRETHPQWKGDQVSYNGAHMRVRAERGSASDHACVECGTRAGQWAYDHLDPDQKTSDNGPFSTDPNHYQPMCARCHKRFDLARLAA